jgi:hypothetical protein
LMRTMGIEAIAPKPKLSSPGKGHKIYLPTSYVIGRSMR